MEKINLKKKYPGVADSPKYLVILWRSATSPNYGFPNPQDVEQLGVFGYRTVIKINWAQCCVLCLKPVMPQDFYEISGNTSSFWSDFFDEEEEVYTLTVRVPYCLECRRKVKKIFRREKEGVEVMPLERDGMEFKFRNPEYAKLFKQMNIKMTRK